MLPTLSSGKIPRYNLQPANGNQATPLVKVEVTDKLTYRNHQIFFSPHRKNYYLLLYVKQGSGRHWIDMVPYEFKPNTLYFTNPEHVHLKEEAAITAVRISFTAEFLALKEHSQLIKLPLIENRYKVHTLSFTPAEQQEVEELLDKLVTENERPSEWQHEMIYAYTNVLIIRLSRIYNRQYHAGEPTTNRAFYRRFQACIEENYKQIHRVNAYAELLSVSVSHMNALIKEQSGRTVMEHIHERLLLEAKRILFHTERSVKEIAYELGFQDDSYFNRFFRRMTGQTPLAHRDTIRKMYR